MKKALKLLFGVVLCIFAADQLAAQPAYTILHNFAGSPNDGSRPWESLFSDGSKLYGTTQYGGAGSGGAAYYGTVFSMNADGSGFTLLHSFIGGANDGRDPLGSLISDGTKLYGMTLNGGAGPGPFGSGTVFSINSNGTGFAVLHSFAGSPNDGQGPYGSLISDGTKLYGMTFYGGAGSGGASYYGTIFSMNSEGSAFTILHNFIGGANDGQAPYGSLLSDGTKLYGMTYYGGTGPGPSGSGTIFSINNNGSGFVILHDFAGPPNDGQQPIGSLISDGTKLYGMTYLGGSGWLAANYNGTVFSMNNDGSGFTLLHSFATGPDDGALPGGDLILADGALYGMTFWGGQVNQGVIFSVNTDGSGFSLVHDFAGSPGDGASPRGSLISDGSKLYGMTAYGGTGGAPPGNGTVFSIALPTPVPNYINLAVSPATVSPGGQVTISYTCDFSQWDYRNQPVDIYLAAIRSPLVSDGPGTVNEALGGGTIYGYNRGMRSVQVGVRQPTWTRVTFPPVATTGTVKTTIPGPAGDWVYATAFRYHGTTIWVRSDGKPVENSNLVTAQ
jgi:uncharacterized repeat protein (TIGR03803 family)